MTSSYLTGILLLLCIFSCRKETEPSGIENGIAEGQFTINKNGETWPGESKVSVKLSENNRIAISRSKDDRASDLEWVLINFDLPTETGKLKDFHASSTVFVGGDIITNTQSLDRRISNNQVRITSIDPIKKQIKGVFSFRLTWIGNRVYLKMCKAVGM